MTTHEQNPSMSSERNKTEEKGKTSEMTRKARETAGEAAHQAKEQTRQVAQQAKGEARSMAEERKGQVTSEINSIARAFRSSGQQLRNQNEEPVARYATQIADKLENASSYIEDHSVDDILSDAEAFARRRPEVFLGGAFGLGLLVSRFFKSSERNLYEGEYRESGYYRSGDYRSGDYRGSGYYERTGSAYAPASYSTTGSGAGRTTGQTRRTETGDSEQAGRRTTGESTPGSGQRGSTTEGDSS